MADEAVVVELLGDRGDVVQYIVADGTAIAKGGSFRNAFDDMLSADQRPQKLNDIDYSIGFRCACDNAQGE